MTDEPPVPPDGASGPLVVVDDPDDRRLADYRALNEPGRRRRVEADRSILVVEGHLAVDRLLSSGYVVRSLLVDDHRTDVDDLVRAVRSRGAPVFVGTREVVAATVGFALHRGVVAVAARPPAVDPDRILSDGRAVGDPPVVAVLEGLNDHENIGALFRNAAAFGVSGVLLDPTCADPLYRRSVRVSMGHVLHVPFARLDPWTAGLDRVRRAGFVVAALAPRPSPGGPPSLSLTGLRARARGDGVGVAVLLGAEGPGLSAASLEAADVVVAIPMAAAVDSLNVAAAAAVAFYALGVG